MVVILICGGGNAAHIWAGYGAACDDVEVRVLTLNHRNEKIWNAAIDSKAMLSISRNKDKVTRTYPQPSMVTSVPAAATSGVDIVVFAVAAPAHGRYLQALKPYVKAGMTLAALPGQCNFEYDVQYHWKGLFSVVHILSFRSLPWNCRIIEFGRRASIIATRSSLVGAYTGSDKSPVDYALTVLQRVVGKSPKLRIMGHMLGITLGSIVFIHPVILFSKWQNWDGESLAEPPIFYKDISTSGADLVAAVSEEICEVARCIAERYPALDLTNVTHYKQYLCSSFQDYISDNSSMLKCITTNKGYDDYVHPCQSTGDGKFKPQFNHRFLEEDLPYGLVVIRGIASIAGMKTPLIDQIIEWGQKLLGKDYLVDGELTGRDIASTRCPQRYGMRSLEDIIPNSKL